MRPNDKSPAPHRALTPKQQALVTSAMPFIGNLAKTLAAESRYRLSSCELTAVGYLAAVEAAPSFNPDRGKSFEAFASKAIRGAMRDELARERLRGRVERAEHADDGGAGALAVATALAGRSPHSPEELLDRGFERARVLEALEAAKGELPERERAIVRACIEEGAPVTSVAAKTGFSARVVRALRDRALAYLNRKLRRRGVTEPIRPSWEPVSDRCR